jgi:hypothetical protein
VGVERVSLIASPTGEALYRSLGFTDLREPVLAWRRPGISPQT